MTGTRIQQTIESTHCFANKHLSVNKHVHGESVVHSMSLAALSSQQVFFGRDGSQINFQAVAQNWLGMLANTDSWEHMCLLAGAGCLNVGLVLF